MLLPVELMPMFASPKGLCFCKDDALPAPTTDATDGREAACTAGIRAALAAIADRQERDAAAARLQDQFGAPAYQAARVLAALTSTPGAPTT